MTQEHPLTDFIQGAQRGDDGAWTALFEAIYPDLRRLARARLRRSSRNTLLDTTSLVHESFIRFVSSACAKLEDRQQFLCYLSRTMRSVVVDSVRARRSERRGGGALRVTLDDRHDAANLQNEAEILKVHDALEHLAHYGQRIAQVVEMRYFAGMTEQQIAEVFGVTERTVRRDWEKARTLLAEAMEL